MLARTIPLLALLATPSSLAGLDSHSPIFTFGGVNFEETSSSNITSRADDPFALSVDGNKNTYVGGETRGVNINFSANSANQLMVLANTTLNNTKYTTDGFLTKFNRSGIAQWTFLAQGSSNAIDVKAVANDAENNVYLVIRGEGDVSYRLMKNDGEIKSLFDQIFPDEDEAFSIVKLDSLGNIQWVKLIEAKLDELSYSWVDPSDISVDDTGVYISGDFAGDVFVNPADKSVWANSNEIPRNEWSDDVFPGDGFLIKFDLDGDFQWGKYIGGQMGLDSIVDIDTDGQYLYSVSELMSTPDGTSFDGMYSQYTHHSNFNNDETGSRRFEYFCAVQKLDTSTGEVIWTKTIETAPNATGKSGKCYPSMITVGSNTVSISGSFRGGLDFDPSASSVSSGTTVGDTDAFVLSLDKSTGEQVWYGVFGISGSDNQSDGLSAYGDSLYLSFDLTNSSGATTSLIGSGNASNISTWASEIEVTPNGPTDTQDIAIVKLNENGSAEWIQQWNGRPGYRTIDAFASTHEGEVIMSGQFTLEMDLDPTGGETLVKTKDYELHGNESAKDAFVVRLNADGSYVETLPENNPPVADEAEKTIPINSGEIEIDLFSLISDPENDEFSISNLRAKFGMVSMSGGMLKYQPQANFSGQDVITYTVTDSNGDSSTGRYIVNIGDSSDQDPDSDSNSGNNDSNNRVEISGGSVNIVFALLVVLAGVVRSVNIRKFSVLAALLGLVTIPAKAETADSESLTGKWYANANLGITKTHGLDNIAGTTSNAHGSAGALDIDDKGLSGSLYLGYQYSENIGVEVGYWNLGDRKVSFNTASSNDDAYLDIAQHGYVTSGHGAHINVVGSYWFADDWKASAKLGYLQWRGEFNTMVEGTKVRTTKVTDGDITVGLEVGHRILSNVEVNASLSYVSLKGSENSEAAFGARYFF